MVYWPTPLARTCMLEGNKFWFYSLICSILGGLLQFVDVAARTHDVKGMDGDEQKSGNESSSEREGKDKQSLDLDRGKKMDTIKRKLVIDGLDLLSPGFVTGWISTSASVVGFSSVLSTLLSSKEIWDRLKD
ncbi:uncharacterized protein RAG0_05424 [Rhynchosporium agropyri]|uniref:Uncharacterized protein n=3 Tax=Rhynchosporium TaxID=38037 RepID=A0A1E1LVA2_RHYSE|nr:uncharacterized protein RAG0_05424 [Rhynchosporium agropyri]CZS98916.1 uncharacterized protein RCO7_14521 [Rhynchosporium commune]CZT40791.1 uncharacterized protein RSE6_00447 [Rhynchosporium secalis]